MSNDDTQDLLESKSSTILDLVGSIQFLLAQLVKNQPEMQETQIWSLGWEDPLEKGKASQSIILAWRIPQTV